jgi:hypothetical protein
MRVWIVGKVEIHQEAPLTHQLRFEVTPRRVGLNSSQAVHKWQEPAVLALVNGQHSRLVVHHEINLSVPMINLDITGRGLHLNASFFGKFLHGNFQP